MRRLNYSGWKLSTTAIQWAENMVLRGCTVLKRGDYMLEVTNILDIQPVQLIDSSCIFVQIDRRLTICKTTGKVGILDLCKAIFIEWEWAVMSNCRNGFWNIFKKLTPKPTVQQHKVCNHISIKCEKMVVYWHSLHRNCRVYSIHV